MVQHTLYCFWWIRRIKISINNDDNFIKTCFKNVEYK